MTSENANSRACIFLVIIIYQLETAWVASVNSTVSDPQSHTSRISRQVHKLDLSSPHENIRRNFTQPKIHVEWRLPNPGSETLPALTARLIRGRIVSTGRLVVIPDMLCCGLAQISPLAHLADFPIWQKSYTAHRAVGCVIQRNSLLNSRIPPLLAFRLPSTARGVAVSLTPYACTSSNASTENQSVLNAPSSSKKRIKYKICDSKYIGLTPRGADDFLNFPF